MFAFRPNIEDLDRKRDIGGLLKALNYPGKSEKAQRVRSGAADRLKRYRHLKVLQALAGVMSGTEMTLQNAARDSIRWLLRANRSTPLDLGNPEELMNRLKSATQASRADEWQAIRERVRNETKPPARIAMLSHQVAYNDGPTPLRSPELDKWREDEERRLAPKLEAARADLEAKWRAEDTVWEQEEAFLQNWTP